MFGLSFHRKEQWDLKCHPILCVHRKTDNGNKSTRVFCIWWGGIEVVGLRRRARAWDEDVRPCLCCDGPGIRLVKVATSALSGADKSVRKLEGWACWAHVDEVGDKLKEQIHAPAGAA